ncbi:MAG TPA: hypothetical protein VFK09_02985 [Gemmatimonadales bacterium]|nr:hypothetical protein [Gemmatimonadales bacterium]
MSRGGPLAGRSAALALCLAIAAGSAANAQIFGLAHAPDSASAFETARDAQRDFERFRRTSLPKPIDDSRGTTCDAQIGRFCYWYAPPFDGPPPELPEVHDARAALLRVLADAAARSPTDGWVAGQRVRYLVEQGTPALALTAARECQGVRWWCTALEGYALHAAGDYAAADSVYGVALLLMPESERCTWTDLSPLLDEDAGRYGKLTCDERSAANRRIWWLARPLLAVPGNDLRTEHYARLTLSRTLEGAETPHGIAWGPDMRELTVRYGWPLGWSRAFPRPGSVEGPPVTGHERSPAFWFFPAAPLEPKPGEPARVVTWELTRERPPARYGPPYAGAFGTIERAQVARFRRGAGMQTVAGYDLTRDTTVSAGKLHVALAVSRDPETPPAVSDEAFVPAGAVSVASPWVPALVSLEARDPELRRAARVRALLPAAPPVGGLSVSDLLLFRPAPDQAARRVDAVLPAPLFSSVVPQGTSVGLYWETYGANPSQPLRIEVRAQRGDGDGLPSPFGLAGCAPPGETPLRIAWEEPPPGRTRGAGRSVVADLSRLGPGRYVLAVAVAAPGGDPVCAGREVEITRR